MNDYMELIKRLRVAVDVHEVKGCVLEISAETCAEIADAIEQLVKEQDKLQNDLWEANDCLEYANDILKKVETERDAAVAIIEEFSEMDYCHNFQLSADWVVDFIHKITKIQKKAKEWRGVQK